MLARVVGHAFEHDPILFEHGVMARFEPFADTRNATRSRSQPLTLRNRQKKICDVVASIGVAKPNTRNGPPGPFATG